MTAMMNVKAAQSPMLHCSGKYKKPMLSTVHNHNVKYKQLDQVAKAKNELSLIGMQQGTIKSHTNMGLGAQIKTTKNPDHWCKAVVERSKRTD
jgi:hypothetical protein